MTVSTASKIARNYAFQNRVAHLMVKAAIAQLNGETPSAGDILLGQRILKGTESVLQWSIGVLTNATIMAGAHVEDGESIPDTDMEFAVNSLWPAFAV